MREFFGNLRTSQPDTTALSGSHFTLRGLLLPTLRVVKNLKSSSNADAVITNQEFTRRLFNRLDGVIAWPE
jgi:hypothetical protein